MSAVAPDPADALTRGAMARESPGAPQHPDLRMHPTTQSRSPKSGQLPANRTIDHWPRRCQSAANATRRGKRRTANLAIRPHAEKMDTQLRHGWVWRGHLDPHLLCERCNTTQQSFYVDESNEPGQDEVGSACSTSTAKATDTTSVNKSEGRLARIAASIATSSEIAVWQPVRIPEILLENEGTAASRPHSTPWWPAFQRRHLRCRARQEGSAPRWSGRRSSIAR